MGAGAGRGVVQGGAQQLHPLDERPPAGARGLQGHTGVLARLRQGGVGGRGPAAHAGAVVARGAAVEGVLVGDERGHGPQHVGVAHQRVQGGALPLHPLVLADGGRKKDVERGEVKVGVGLDGAAHHRHRRRLHARGRGHQEGVILHLPVHRGGAGRGRAGGRIGHHAQAQGLVQPRPVGNGQEPFRVADAAARPHQLVRFAQVAVVVEVGVNPHVARVGAGFDPKRQHLGLGHGEAPGAAEVLVAGAAVGRAVGHRTELELGDAVAAAVSLRGRAAQGRHRVGGEERGGGGQCQRVAAVGVAHAQRHGVGARRGVGVGGVGQGAGGAVAEAPAPRDRAAQALVGEGEGTCAGRRRAHREGGHRRLGVGGRRHAVVLGLGVERRGVGRGKGGRSPVGRHPQPQRHPHGRRQGHGQRRPAVQPCPVGGKKQLGHGVEAAVVVVVNPRPHVLVGVGVGADADRVAQPRGEHRAQGAAVVVVAVGGAGRGVVEGAERDVKNAHAGQRRLRAAGWSGGAGGGHRALGPKGCGGCQEKCG